MKLKTDKELFEMSFTEMTAKGGTHEERFSAALKDIVQKTDPGINIQYTYREKWEKPLAEYSASERAADAKVRKVFRSINEWQERDDIRDPMPTGVFADVPCSLFKLDGVPYPLDYFAQMDQNSIWLERYIEPLEDAMLYLTSMQEGRRSLSKTRLTTLLAAGLTLIFFFILKSKETWADNPLLGLVIAPLPFVFGAFTLYCLFRWFSLWRITGRRETEKAYDCFLKEARGRIPRIHLTLRFYHKWAENKKRPKPEKLKTMQAFLDSAVRLYDQVEQGLELEKLDCPEDKGIAGFLGRE